jgi:hypothetical protein
VPSRPPFRPTQDNGDHFFRPRGLERAGRRSAGGAAGQNVVNQEDATIFNRVVTAHSERAAHDCGSVGTAQVGQVLCRYDSLQRAVEFEAKPMSNSPSQCVGLVVPTSPVTPPVKRNRNNASVGIHCE